MACPSWSFVYVHGLISDGNARKAQKLRVALQSYGPLISPTLYTPEEFSGYTITSGFPTVSKAIKQACEVGAGSKGVILMGSSCGGLLAMRFLQTCQPGYELVRGLVLFAPAIGIQVYMRTGFTLPLLVGDGSLDATQLMHNWEHDGSIVMASSWPVPAKLMWSFMQDIDTNHTVENQAKPIDKPILLIQGESDEIVPPRFSKEWIGKQSSSLKAVYLPNGDHTLSNVGTQVFVLSIRQYLTFSRWKQMWLIGSTNISSEFYKIYLVVVLI